MDKQAKSYAQMVEELINRYKESWSYSNNSSLIEELEIVYRRGVKGFDSMTYDEVLNEYDEYEDV